MAEALLRVADHRAPSTNSANTAGGLGIAPLRWNSRAEASHQAATMSTTPTRPPAQGGPSATPDNRASTGRDGAALAWPSALPRLGASAEQDLGEPVDIGVELGRPHHVRRARTGRSISTTSATRPGRGLITATTSERNTASAMPCVTISVVAGRSVQIRRSSTLRR